MERDARLTEKAAREIERVFQLKSEAVRLLDLIVSEFRTDPACTQCFDLRIVRRSIDVVRELRARGEID